MVYLVHYKNPEHCCAWLLFWLQTSLELFWEAISLSFEKKICILAARYLNLHKSFFPKVIYGQMVISVHAMYITILRWFINRERFSRGGQENGTFRIILCTASKRLIESLQLANNNWYLKLHSSKSPGQKPREIKY